MSINQKLVQAILGERGHTVQIASNGRVAISLIQQQDFDVVLMDVQMPEMDGLEASREICARWSAGERPRIIAMTANAMQGDREVCLEVGMDDYVSKPIRVEEQVAALERAAMKTR